MAERFDEILQDHIKSGRNDEAKAMLNEQLARTFVDSQGTLLHQAAEHDNAVVARRLIELGADLDRSDRLAGAPLATALLNQSAAAVRVLLEAGARVDTVHEDVGSELALGLDAVHVGTEAFGLLVRHLRTLASTSDEVADMLIRAGCCMPHAATLGDVDLLECMLRRAVDIDSRYDQETSALHVAVDLNDVALADCLVKNGIDVDAMDENGASALLKAAEKRNTTMVAFLLERAAYPDVKGELHDYTPLFALFMALDEGPDESVECIELLLQHGADLRTCKNLPEMFKYALNCSCDKAAKLLMAHMAMLEKLGKPVDKSIVHEMHDSFRDKVSELWQYYGSCQKVLAIRVFENASLLDLLNESDDKLKLLVRRETFLREVRKVSSEHKLRESYSYYYHSMMRRIEKAKRPVE